MKLIIRHSKKLEELRKDVKSVSDSFLDVIKQGDSKVQIKSGFNNK